MELTKALTSKKIQVGDLNIHYNEAGKGPVLLFIHGSGPGVRDGVIFRGIWIISQNGSASLRSISPTSVKARNCPCRSTVSTATMRKH
jgi:hypothetical protein